MTITPGGGGLKLPGQGGARLGVPSGAAARADLPEIYEADPGDALPSICVIGASGTGKTHQLGLLVKHLATKGLATIVVSVENKHQGIARLRPLVLPIGAPVRTTTGARPATATEKYNRLIAFRDELREGKYREHLGRPVGALVTDGLMEIGAIVKSHKLDNMPTSRGGEQNTFRAFDEMGVAIIDLMASFREAASDAGKAYGIAPLTVVATCGEVLKDGKFQAMLPGNQAPNMLAYQFEAIFRLAVEATEMGSTEVQYVAHTTPGETAYPQTGRWDAKAPSGLFGQKIVNPNLGEIYEKLVTNYKEGAE